MNQYTIILAALLLLGLGCTSAPPSLEKELSRLETPEDHRRFLEQIHADDQQVRDGSDTQLMLEYGVDSEEVLAYAQAQWKQDALNLEKIDAYLKRFGHPDKEELGSMAASAPWLVIHHQMDVGVRNSYFPILYQAYRNGDIRSTEMSMYLARTYEFVYGERLQMESPYTEEEEIDSLINKLELKKQ